MLSTLSPHIVIVELHAFVRAHCGRVEERRSQREVYFPPYLLDRTCIQLVSHDLSQDADVSRKVLYGRLLA